MTLHSDNHTSHHYPYPPLISKKIQYFPVHESNTAPKSVVLDIQKSIQSGSSLLADIIRPEDTSLYKFARVDFTETFSPEYELKFNFIDMQSQLIDKYKNGELDIPEIVKFLGNNWGTGMVILWLEQNNAYRPFWMQSLSKIEENEILVKLATIRNTKLVEEYNTEEWIRREVVASQRIESIYVSPED